MRLDPTKSFHRFAGSLVRSVQAAHRSAHWQEPARYFPAEQPRADDPEYDAELEGINADFADWLDPGPIEAPLCSAVIQSGDELEFPSALPCGVAAVDRVILKLYTPPEDPSGVVILFHHWLFFDSWLPVNWLLAPLVERYQVAAMVAPHHIGRMQPDLASGEGFVNPNPRNAFIGFRQWQADHLAACALLARESGGARILPVGYSLGGYGLMLHRLVRPPIPTVVICVANEFSRGIFDGPHSERLCRGIAAAGFSRRRFERLTRSLNLACWGEDIGGGDLTWIYAEDDDIEPEESLRAGRRAIAPEREVSIRGNHATALLDRRTIVEEISRRADQLAETV